MKIRDLIIIIIIKIAKYGELASMHIYSVAIETGGTWSHWAVELVQKIGSLATLITGNPLRIHLSVSAVIINPLKGKCSHLAQHF